MFLTESQMAEKAAKLRGLVQRPPAKDAPRQGKIDMAIVTAMLGEGRSVIDIAKRLGSTTSGVYLAMRKAGIPSYWKANAAKRAAYKQAKADAKAVAAQERRAMMRTAYDLREQNLRYREIARRMGTTQDIARRLVREAIRAGEHDRSAAKIA